MPATWDNTLLEAMKLPKPATPMVTRMASHKAQINGITMTWFFLTPWVLIVYMATRIPKGSKEVKLIYFMKH